jgi:hypothetical protein
MRAITSSSSHKQRHEYRIIDVTPVSTPASLSFFAKPSRLPVGLHDGITGAVYVFDVYHNLIAAPTTVSFELSSPTGAVQKQQVSTRAGAAWTEMDSTSQQGSSKFVARAGDISSVQHHSPGAGRSLRSEDQRPAFGAGTRSPDRSGARLQRKRGAGWNDCYVH